MKYGYDAILTTGAGGVAVEYAFRGNDLYDPEYNSLGQNKSVAGYLDMMGRYSTFFVRGCAIDVEIAG